MSKTSASTKSETTLRAMSFNLRTGNADKDTINKWENRKDNIITSIKKFNPDIVGAQECLGFQADFLKENLTEFEFLGVSRDPKQPRGEMAPVLYKKDKFDLLDSGFFWLSETPDVPGSISWDSSLPRLACWVLLNEKNSNKTLLFLNTHLDHRGAEARLKGAKLICQKIEKLAKNNPVIITGDFNDLPGSKPYKIFLEAKIDKNKLVDTLRSIYLDSQNDEGTFHAFSGEKDGKRIDWIFVSDYLPINDYYIDAQPGENEIYPSDHFPIGAVLTLK